MNDHAQVEPYPVGLRVHVRNRPGEIIHRDTVIESVERLPPGFPVKFKQTDDGRLFVAVTTCECLVYTVAGCDAWHDHDDIIPIDDDEEPISRTRKRKRAEPA